MAAENQSSLKLDHCFDNYILVDAGSNLTNKKFNRDIESVITRAKDAGVRKIVVLGCSIKTSKEALRLSRFYPGTLYCTAGVHPYDGKSWTDESLEELRTIASSPECVGIGVCGLDYNKNYTEPSVQRNVFRHQVQLASNLKKPLVIHEKDANDDLILILREFETSLPEIILHSYCGSFESTEKYLQMGMYICITGLVSRDNSSEGIQTLLESRKIPLDRMIVQSDSPFLYPNIRGKKLPDKVKKNLTERSMAFLQRYCTFQRNEPCSLPIIIEIIAGFLEKTPEEVALGTTINALKIFVLD